MMSTPALVRAPLGSLHGPHAFAQAEPFPQTRTTDPDDGRDVYRIVVRQPAYEPTVAHAHWRASSSAMAWSAFAFPCGVAAATAATCMSAVSCGFMAFGAVASATVGCTAIFTAPVLLPASMALTFSTVSTGVAGGMLAGAALGLGAAMSVYNGVRAVCHAAQALAQELLTL